MIFEQNYRFTLLYNKSVLPVSVIGTNQLAHSHSLISEFVVYCYMAFYEFS